MTGWGGSWPRRTDVIISDIGMPEEDGYAFIRRVPKLAADAGGRTPAAAPYGLRSRGRPTAGDASRFRNAARTANSTDAEQIQKFTQMVHLLAELEGATLMIEGTQPQITDPHGLLESGEELAPVGQLASLLGCSKNALRELLHGPLRSVRWARREPDPTVYAVSDARLAFEPYRAEVEARQQRHVELEASGRAAALAAKEARIAADAKRKAEAARRPQFSHSKPSPPAAKPSGEKRAKKNSPPTSPQPQHRTPEVIVLARRPSQKPDP
jgi:hypothetical protein